MKVKFNNEEFPKGTEFDIGGLLLVNQDEVEFDDEQIEAFEARNGRKLKDALKGVSGAEVKYTPVKGGDS